MSYSFQFGPVFAAWPLLLEGTWKTIELSFLAMLGGLAVAIVCAWAKTGGPAPLRWLVNAYIELIRNTPFLVQLFFFFFALPAIGLRWSAHTAALTAMVVNLGAYATEIIRAGIEAVPRGHIEAGVSLAMTKWQVLRHIILKQAFQKVYPALSSQIIIVMLGSAVVSQISAQDLTYAANLVASRNFRNFEVYLLVALTYLLLAMLMRALLRGVGSKLFKAK